MAILDIGNKGDWISQTFYNEIRDMEVRFMELSELEKERIAYRDFNGKKFYPTGKVDLMIKMEVSKDGLEYRTMRFNVANKAAFEIVLGRDTIRKYGLYNRGMREAEGEGFVIGDLKLTEGMLSTKSDPQLLLHT